MSEPTCINAKALQERLEVIKDGVWGHDDDDKVQAIYAVEWLIARLLEAHDALAQLLPADDPEAVIHAANEKRRAESGFLETARNNPPHA